MIRLPNQSTHWILASGVVLTSFIGFFVFHDLNETKPQEAQEQTSIVQSKERLPMRDEQNVDECFTSMGLQPKQYSSDKITSFYSASNRTFAASIDRNSEEEKNDRQEAPTNENKLAKVQKAFNEAFADRRKANPQLRILIQNADKEEKAWIFNALVDRFNSETDPKIRKVCLVSMVWYPDQASELYVKALSDEDRGVRQLAAHAASHILKEKDIHALYQAIKEDKGEPPWHKRTIAREAIFSLGYIGGDQASGILRKIWNDKELSRGCEEALVSAMGLSGDVRNFEILSSILKNQDQLLRNNAAYGLNGLARKNKDNQKVVNDVKKVLVQYLNDKNNHVRLNVVDALSWMGNSEDIKLLEPLLYDEFSAIRSYTENGEVKKQVVYPVREKAQKVIDKINARVASQKDKIKGEN